MISLAAMRARSLLATVNGAICHGDWIVDGACDPELAIIRLESTLGVPDARIADIDQCTDDLARIGQAAIDAGDWTVAPGHDVSHFRRNPPANDNRLATAA